MKISCATIFGAAMLSSLVYLPAWGACYKVEAAVANTIANNQIRPEDGTASAWAGACDTCNGSLGLPNVINVSDSSFQPDGSLIASSVAPLSMYGSAAGYDPERVFFRCAANDPVFEMFSTNADDLYSGWYSGGDTVGNSIGLQGAYRTAWANVLLRLTHVETGQYFTSVWQERPLHNLDKDSRGFQLIKAKNLSAVRAELFRAPSESVTYYPSTTKSQNYLYTQPAGYIAIKGPGIDYPNVGQVHIGGNWAGWHYNWPGAVGLYNRVTLRRYPTCAVTNVTPQVVFSSISVEEINRGVSRDASFEVAFKCQTGVSSSVSINGTAIGVKASAGSKSAAVNLGLVNQKGGLTYLLSDRYGSAGIARGVGIRILRNGSVINLLQSDNSVLGDKAANDIGWYPVIGPSSNNIGGSGGIDQYSEIFRARLEKLSGGTQEPVSPGKIEATAEVVIRVQ